jgi:hypothetical protein
MNRISRLHPIRRVTVALAGLAAALLASAAASPAAFARPAPPRVTTGPAPATPQVHTIIAGGMSGWQIILIAAGAAVLAAVVAVALDRAHAARRHQTAPSA